MISTSLFAKFQVPVTKTILEFSTNIDFVHIVLQNLFIPSLLWASNSLV